MNTQYLISFIAASLSGIILGKAIIPLLHQMKFGQSIREEGPQSHLKKSGTPTMGGMIFLAGFLCALALTLNFSRETLIMVLGTFGMGLVGFLDDYLIIKRRKNEGLRPKQKLAGQFLVAVLLTGIVSYYYGTSIKIPFIKESWDMGLIYYPFMVVFILAIANGVNLTDGLDGLAGTVTFFNVIFFTAAATLLNMVGLASAGMALAGGLIAFLFYNRYPAKVFMGDLGSLALGGAIAAMSMMTGTVLYVLIVGIIYVVETLSVTIQVAVYKKTKKRVFKMAPLHHHFELSGWKEQQIVSRFAFITILMAAVSLFLL